MDMKLLIDKSKCKVIFAEAGKECVDFLFHMLSLPLGSVVGFLTKESMPGGIGTLYGSLEGLGNDFMQEGFSKGCLLNPTSAVGSASNVPLLTTTPADAGHSKQFYLCGSCCEYVSYVVGTPCPRCRLQMTMVLTYVAPKKAAKRAGESSGGGGGYVKGVVTYMILDDLSVQPMSTISSITLLNKFSIQDVSVLEEKNVTLDVNLALVSYSVVGYVSIIFH